MEKIEAVSLMELSNVLYDLHTRLASSPNGFVKPVLTIVNRDTAPVYTLIVTER